MCERERIIAVNFDGCLCENAWPDIGEARQDVIDALLSRQQKGAKIILWSCRVGERLDAVVRWCADHGITFDAVNANLPVNIAAFGNDCRKIIADEYWDDKAINPEICDVSIPSWNLNNSPMLHKRADEETAMHISEERTVFTKTAQPIMPQSFIEAPIDPEALGHMHPLWNPKEFPGDSPVVPTDAMPMRWTIAEAIEVCKALGLKFAYNLDGGGSTETVIGRKHINDIYDNTTGRLVPTFICFNGTTSFD